MLDQTLNMINFELLRTGQVELRTHSNPGLSTKTELWTQSNPYKKPELRNCSARNGPKPGPNPEKPKFKPFRTQVRLPKPNTKPTRTLQKSQTSNLRTRFDPNTIHKSINCTKKICTLVFKTTIFQGLKTSYNELKSAFVKKSLMSIWRFRSMDIHWLFAIHGVQPHASVFLWQGLESVNHSRSVNIRICLLSKWVLWLGRGQCTIKKLGEMRNLGKSHCAVL